MIAPGCTSVVVGSLVWDIGWCMPRRFFARDNIADKRSPCRNRRPATALATVA